MGERGKIPRVKLPVAHIKDSIDTVATASKPTKAIVDNRMQEEARWRAEEDLRTLHRAEEIRGDKSRMGACKIVAKEQIDKLNKIK